VVFRESLPADRNRRAEPFLFESRPERSDDRDCPRQCAPANPRANRIEQLSHRRHNPWLSAELRRNRRDEDACGLAARPEGHVRHGKVVGHIDSATQLPPISGQMDVRQQRPEVGSVRLVAASNEGAMLSAAPGDEGSLEEPLREMDEDGPA